MRKRDISDYGKMGKIEENDKVGLERDSISGELKRKRIELEELKNKYEQKRHELEELERLAQDSLEPEEPDRERHTGECKGNLENDGVSCADEESSRPSGCCS